MTDADETDDRPDAAGERADGEPPSDGREANEGPNDDGQADHGGPKPMGWWDMVVDDLAARADEYRDRGWTAVEVHPGDVTALDGEYGEDVGLDVLVPDNEYADLIAALEGSEVDEYRVYRTEVGDTVVALVAAEATAATTAVLVPVYYDRSDDAAAALFDQAVDDGRLTVFLRRLDGERMALELERPELLAPEVDESDTHDSEASPDDE